ncbi:putative repeat protein (TIGR01451 family) [Sphingomonas insulae]|uniref:DUF11 domain-containing protein n=1 Tax=Sphingomonas insulae TaxID=424800 RepID=A0ABP3ST92_9SPHN|nr:hypothetical protein [Sphingomonas insulae]NIJ30142.1 putative repeat protein (TIGR01451 family) [Sphingomonas insulae]
MTLRILAAAIPALVLAAPLAAAGPLTMTTRMMVEKRVAARDGSTATTMIPATRAVPGDRITVVLAYRNGGTAPIGNLVLANPVPRNVAFRGAAAGSAAPEVSVDGKTYGSLDGLRVTTPDGATRPATANDVTHVRWRLSSPVAAGQGGELAFQAVLK